MPESKHIYRVCEITKDIKLILENTFGEVWVEGEISNFRPASSGHFYFSLKDEQAVLAAAMFSRSNRDLKFKLEDGLKVICFGKIDVYPPRGQYQLIVDKIEPKGIGSLQLALEQLKEKLEKEGLFAPEHKKPIPYLPSRIGVVTSLSGAAIRDILKVLDRRFSDVHIIINPAQVQGDKAKEEISEAIKDLNRLNERLTSQEHIEVMIVGRGGGSIEELWAFNEEVVARAIYNSRIPVISAVGHERDWTIADLVSDLRAPTPSAAAELVIPRKEELRSKTHDLTQGLNRSFLDIVSNQKDATEDLLHRLVLGIENILKLSTNELESARRKISLLNPAILIRQHKERIIDLARQSCIRLQHFLELRHAVFNTAAEKLDSLSPLNILSRGYSIAFKMPENTIVKDAKFVKIGDAVKIKLHKGEILSQVTEVSKNG
ncbi:MAG: exodeoxyribonuclease VII large subunit [Candidatus Omnitrophota bacterium]